MIIMAKDLFALHTPLHSAGTEIRIRVLDDVSFFMRYRRSECAEFLVILDFGKSYFTLFDFRLSFCLVCGRFLGFGASYEVCWICEYELE